MIREVGRIPVERDALYNVVRRWDLDPLPPEPPIRGRELAVVN